MDAHLAIRQARKRAGLFQAELAELVGCSQQTIVDIESGRIKRSKYLADICSELGLNYDAVKRGAVNSEAELVSVDFGSPVPVLEPSAVPDWLAGASYHVALAGRQPCPVNHGRRTFALRASGDLMEPDIRHGDLVHVDPDRGWASGDIVCLFLGSSAAPTFRRLYQDGSRYYAVATRDGRHEDVRLVERLGEVESSALRLLGGAALAWVAGRAVYAGRLYS